MYIENVSVSMLHAQLKSDTWVNSRVGQTELRALFPFILPAKMLPSMREWEKGCGERFFPDDFCIWPSRVMLVRAVCVSLDAWDMYYLHINFVLGSFECCYSWVVSCKEKNRFHFQVDECLDDNLMEDECMIRRHKHAYNINFYFYFNHFAISIFLDLCALMSLRLWLWINYILQEELL